jgi:hypothetical protein
MNRIERANELFERTKHWGGIGHMLAHRREVHVNTNPLYSQAWRNSEADVLYVVKDLEFGTGSIAHRIKGTGPKQLPIYASSNYLRPDGGGKLFDVQVNVVRDMHRSIHLETRRWLLRFMASHAENDLQLVAATMLASGITREEGIEILALTHGDLFSKDLPEPPQPRRRSPVNKGKKRIKGGVRVITDEEWENCGDEDELREITEYVSAAIDNDLGIIKTEEDVFARLKLAQAAFEAVPDVGIDLPDPSTMPMDIFENITVPRITEDMVPSVLWEFAKSNSVQIGAAREAIVVSSLFACTAAISDDVKIQPRSNATWLESPRIWGVLIGPPSSKKSPAASVAIKPLQKLDHQRSGAAAEKRAQYELAMKVYKAQEAAYVKAAAKGDGVGDPPILPEEPQAERLLVMDTTPEALVNIAVNQTRGLALYRDELSGWFGSHDAYKSGGKGSKDTPFWLSAYNGDGWTVDCPSSYKLEHSRA